MRKLELEVDIIHSHCQFGDVVALLLAKQYKTKKLIRTVHNEREWGRRPLRKLLLTNTLFPFVFDAEFGVAKQVVENLDERPLARFPLRKRATLLHNSINTTRFINAETDREGLLQKWNIPSSAYVVGAIGRLMPQKGYDVLLKAAQILTQERDDIYFLIVGNGHLEEMLRQTAALLGLNQKVIFTGLLPEIEKIIPCFDVFVNSSDWEGLPTAIIESMVAKVPIVATNVAGTAELIEHEKRGYLVPPQNPIEMATAIKRMLNNSLETNNKLANCAFEFAVSHFSIEIVARKHEAIYQRLVEE